MRTWKLIKAIREDAGVSASNGVACNNVGGAQVAGLGVGSQGEPPKKKKKLREIFKRM